MNEIVRYLERPDVGSMIERGDNALEVLARSSTKAGALAFAGYKGLLVPEFLPSIVRFGELDTIEKVEGMRTWLGALGLRTKQEIQEYLDDGETERERIRQAGTNHRTDKVVDGDIEIALIGENAATRRTELVVDGALRNTQTVQNGLTARNRYSEDARTRRSLAQVDGAIQINGRQCLSTEEIARISSGTRMYEADVTRHLGNRRSEVELRRIGSQETVLLDGQAKDLEASKYGEEQLTQRFFAEIAGGNSLEQIRAQKELGIAQMNCDVKMAEIVYHDRTAREQEFTKRWLSQEQFLANAIEVRAFKESRIFEARVDAEKARYAYEASVAKSLGEIRSSRNRALGESVVALLRAREVYLTQLLDYKAQLAKSSDELLGNVTREVVDLANGRPDIKSVEIIANTLDGRGYDLKFRLNNEYRRKFTRQR